jgi:hypothetical protein
MDVFTYSEARQKLAAVCPQRTGAGRCCGMTLVPALQHGNSSIPPVISAIAGANSC